MAGKKRPAGRLMSMLLALAVVILAWVVGAREQTPAAGTVTTVPTSAAPAEAEDSRAMTVRFIDVGQGASTLISQGDTHILVDAGENDRGQDVVEKLQSWGVTRLALAIGTHPHSDHIGGMDDVLRAFEVDAYMMPEVTHTSATFLSVLDALEDRDIPVIYPKVGEKFTYGSLNMTVLGPIEPQEDDLNNASIVVKIESAYGSVLLPGDAEKSSEQRILASGADLKADVLQLAHHGSNTSNTAAFLKAVDPIWAVIPVGAGYSYGHPHKEVLARLEKLSITTFRTDWNGTISCRFDSGGISFVTEK